MIINLTRAEVNDALLCEGAVWRYWNSRADIGAIDHYMSKHSEEQVETELTRFFIRLREYHEFEGGPSIDVYVGPALSDLRWVMYRHVFDREYPGINGDRTNVPLDIMGLVWYVMFWPVARKMSLADTRVVKIVYGKPGKLDA